MAINILTKSSNSNESWLQQTKQLPHSHTNKNRHLKNKNKRHCQQLSKKHKALVTGRTRRHRYSTVIPVNLIHSKTCPSIGCWWYRKMKTFAFETLEHDCHFSSFCGLGPPWWTQPGYFFTIKAIPPHHHMKLLMWKSSVNQRVTPGWLNSVISTSTHMPQTSSHM